MGLLSVSTTGTLPTSYFSRMPRSLFLVYQILCLICASLVAQRVKNLPAMQETQVQSLS